jgi:hypothetical protein
MLAALAAYVVRWSTAPPGEVTNKWEPRDHLQSLGWRMRAPPVG